MSHVSVFSWFLEPLFVSPAFTATGLLTKDVGAFLRTESQALVIAGGIAFLCAVTVLASIPFATRQLDDDGSRRSRGGIDYLILGRIPLRMVLAAVYVSVVIAGIAAFRMVWRILFELPVD